MVTESLKTYFKTNLSGVDKLEEKLEYLFSSEHDLNLFEEKETKLLVNLIENAKIVDPAVGSGAFPMGALNKLVFILGKVDPGNQHWKEAQIKAADAIPDPSARREAKARIEEFFKTKNADYGRKLYLIQRCIYGVDIQQIAVEIAKLRFFISLLVDEKIDKTKDNWGIEPLPNLDFKIMQGNSLISEFLGIDFDKDSEKQKAGSGLGFEEEEAELIKEFELKKMDYQNEPDKDKKAEFKQEVEDLMIAVFEAKIKSQQADYFRQVAEIEHKYETLKDKKQREDIVAKEKAKLSKKTGFDLEGIENQLREFTSKRKVRPFFPWRLYFAEVFEKGGFDIVIGNPPYVRSELLDQAYKERLVSCYASIGNGTADLYVYFFGRGLSILKGNGVLIFISGNKYLKTLYGIGLRKILCSFNTRMIIDFFELPVFEASTDTAISIIQNNKGDCSTQYYPVKTLEFLNLKELTSGSYLNVIKDETEWKFVDVIEERLLEKVCENAVTLKEFTGDKIYYGIKTAFNKAFILDYYVAKKLLKSESKAIVKKYARSKDIRKWGLLDNNKYFLATGFDLDVKSKYPSAYSFLSQYERELKLRQDKGKYWWNLRACAYYPDFEKTKIIYMHTAKDHEFMIDEEGRYINNSCYMIVSDSKYLFCFLNSKLFKWFKKIKFVAYGDAEGSGRVKLDYNKMVTVPIKKASKSDQIQFEILVDKILSVKRANPTADTSTLESQIDQLVYQLYGLTEEEIKIVEGVGK